MRENLQRPVDLARAHGLSTQAVRNYEALGILPAARRTESGYRVYTPRHARALDAFQRLLPGHGHATAAAIMQAVNRGALEDAFRLIDESHTQLREDRATLRAVTDALTGLQEPVEAGKEAQLFVGAVAHQLGLRAATVRKWERAGLLQPQRDRRTGYRVYGPADLRDARLVHQLRRGGYPLERIAPVIAKIREAGGIAPLEAMLHDWHARHTARGRALLAGAAALDRYLTTE